MWTPLVSPSKDDMRHAYSREFAGTGDGESVEGDGDTIVGCLMTFDSSCGLGR